MAEPKKPKETPVEDPPVEDPPIADPPVEDPPEPKVKPKKTAPANSLELVNINPIVTRLEKLAEKWEKSSPEPKPVLPPVPAPVQRSTWNEINDFIFAKG